MPTRKALFFLCRRGTMNDSGYIRRWINLTMIAWFGSSLSTMPDTRKLILSLLNRELEEEPWNTILHFHHRFSQKKNSRNSCKWQKCYAELFTYTANEGPGRIQYKCLVPIYVFPKMKLRGSLFPKHNYNILSPNFHIHVSVSNLYIPRVGLPILLQPNRRTDPGNI